VADEHGVYPSKLAAELAAVGGPERISTVSPRDLPEMILDLTGSRAPRSSAASASWSSRRTILDIARELAAESADLWALFEGPTLMG
jgi:hypothetical protein